MAHAHAPNAPGFDPRKTITPESFSVAPHLLGLPLASPSRRLAAILIDLLLCALLANSGAVFMALAAAVAFFWFAGHKLGKGGTFFSRSARAGFRVAGALFLFIFALSVWSKAKKTAHRLAGDDDGPAEMSMAGNRRPSTGGAGDVVDGLAFGAQLTQVVTAKDSAHAFRAAHGLVSRMRRLHMTDAQIRETLGDAAGDAEKPFVAAALRSVMPSAASSPADAPEADSAPADDGAAAGAAVPRSPDSLAAAYVGAVRKGDTTRAEQLRPRLGSVFAKDSLSELHGRVESLQASNAELKREKEKAENRGLLATLLSVLDDLGIGFGWTGLYFTAFTAMMKGRTPGKRLVGIRVLRLDGEPMTLWASFERFGGYAAGLFTGLSGYAQVFWDRNRQAIQDKISETVVIREPKGFVLPVAPHLRPAPAYAGVPLRPGGAPSPVGGAPYGPSGGGPYPGGPYGPGTPPPYRPAGAAPYGPPGAQPGGPAGVPASGPARPAGVAPPPQPDAPREQGSAQPSPPAGPPYPRG
jgi:hypothetical protein